MRDFVSRWQIESRSDVETICMGKAKAQILTLLQNWHLPPVLAPSPILAPSSSGTPSSSGHPPPQFWHSWQALLWSKLGQGGRRSGKLLPRVAQAFRVLELPPVCIWPPGSSNMSSQAGRGFTLESRETPMVALTWTKWFLLLGVPIILRSR